MQQKDFSRDELLAMTHVGWKPEWGGFVKKVRRDKLPKILPFISIEDLNNKSGKDDDYIKPKQGIKIGIQGEF